MKIHSSETPRILMLVGGDHRAHDVGEQFLATMVSEYPRDSLRRFSTVRRDQQLTQDPWLGFESTMHPVATSAKPGFSTLSYWRYGATTAASHAGLVARLVKDQEFDLIWIILNHSTIIQLADRIVPDLKVPVITHVWDTPEYLGSKLRLDPFTYRAMQRAFHRVMRRASFGVTVSPQLTDLYHERYGLNSRPMVFCPPLETWRETKKISHSRDSITVVFAGTLYAYREWDAFLDAIESRNQSGIHPPVNVTCLGTRSRWCKDRDWVQYKPLLPMEEAATIVNEADVAYLPYWMDRKHSFFVRTAFPGKLSFYVAAGTPVFYHGPHDSTPTAFLKRLPVGKACASFSEQEINHTLDAILEESYRTRYPESRRQTLHDVFHPDRCIEIFAQAIESALGRGEFPTKPREELAT